MFTAICQYFDRFFRRRVDWQIRYENDRADVNILMCFTLIETERYDLKTHTCTCAKPKFPNKIYICSESCNNSHKTLPTAKTTATTIFFTMQLG